MNHHVKHRFLYTLLLVVLLLAGCTGGSIPQTGADLPVLTLNMTEQAITAPGPMAPGLVQVTINNAGQEVRSMNLARLNTDVTMEQFMETLQTDDMAAVSLVALAGGTDVEPGQLKSFTTELKTGTYVAISFPHNDGYIRSSFELGGKAFQLTWLNIRSAGQCHQGYGGHVVGL